MDLDYSFKNLFICNSIITTGVYFWLGTNWAIGAFILFFIASIQILWEQYQKNKNNPHTAKASQASETAYIPESDIRDSETNPRKKFIDQINFEYKTKEGNQGFYTVNVYKGINGNIEGWCHERNAVREFRKDRIVNDKITRVETGEEMTTKEWRKFAMSLNK